MDKTDVIRIHAMGLAEQPYYAPGQIRIYLKRDGYCYATDPEADFRQFEYACISDITDKADLLKDVLIASRGAEALVSAKTPYAGICAASGRDICASLDDMAQIIGPRVVTVPGTERGLHRTLRKTGAVMVTAEEPYVVTMGRTMEEACATLTVLEKSAEVNLKAAVLGGRKPLSTGACRALRAMYGRASRRSPDAGIEVPRAIQGSTSVRLDGEYMLCSPEGANGGEVDLSDMVKVKIADGSYEGERRPDPAWRLHAGIYASRPDAGAVIHTHAKNCSVFAAAEMPLQVEKPEHRSRLGDMIRVTRYARPGTRKLMKRTLAALGDAPGAIMAHHGMICCGRDLEDAREICRLIEAAAEASIDRRLE